MSVCDDAREGASRMVVEMVFYFTSASGLTLYMGRDKFENEDLIAYGWPEDVWFHVDDLSSAHVYLRLKEGQSWETIDPAVLNECAQLVKANSIKGCKMASVKIVYTPWSNLHKQEYMEVGQIGFHNTKLCKYLTVEKDREVVKALERTREERNPDLRAERQKRDSDQLSALKAVRREQQKVDRQVAEDRRRDREARSYDTLWGDRKSDDEDTGIEATNDVTASRAYEDSFM